MLKEFTFACNLVSSNYRPYSSWSSAISWKFVCVLGFCWKSIFEKLKTLYNGLFERLELFLAPGHPPGFGPFFSDREGLFQKPYYVRIGMEDGVVRNRPLFGQLKKTNGMSISNSG
jgi:hypothetical protein